MALRTQNRNTTLRRAVRSQHRLAVNITPAERVARLIVGIAAVIAAIVLLASAGTLLAVTLESLLLAAGLDLAITGGVGHCPLYAKLGHVPTSLRRTR